MAGRKLILVDKMEESYEFIQGLWEITTANFKEEKDSLSSAAATTNSIILAHPAGHRFWKMLLLRQSDFKGIDFYDAMVKKVFGFIKRNLRLLINTRAVFIVLGFIEFTDYKEKVGRV